MKGLNDDEICEFVEFTKKKVLEELVNFWDKNSKYQYFAFYFSFHQLSMLIFFKFIAARGCTVYRIHAFWR